MPLDSLAYFHSMPTEHQDMLGWRVARGDLPGPFWPGGQLKRRPDEDGTVHFFKAAPFDDRADRSTPVLAVSPLLQQADAYLRTLCTGYRVDPPSVADVQEYASVAQAVADRSEDARLASPCDPRVLVLVTHDGSAIVADLAGADVQTFEPVRSRRERRAQRRRDRRDYCRDRRLHRAARRAMLT